MTAKTPNRPLLRTIAIVGATVIAIGTPIAQYTSAFGLTAVQFSSTGDSTLRAAGYTFSIWGVIGLAAYALPIDRRAKRGRTRLIFDAAPRSVRETEGVVEPRGVE